MKRIFITVFIVVSGLYAYAQEIASYSSLDNTACSGVVANDANVTAVGVCRGSGIIRKAATTYDSQNWTDASVLDTNDYLEWSVTPNSGYSIDFTTLDVRYDRSNNGPTTIELQIDTGSGFSTVFTDLAVDVNGENNTIDISSYTNLTSIVIFRIYGYNAANGVGTLDIEEHTVTNKGIIINGIVTPICASTTTWNGASWDNGVPDINTSVVIDGNYSTMTQGSFSACSLAINSGTLTIVDNDYVEVQHDLVADGDIIVNPEGAFVQVDDNASVSGAGTIIVEKRTAPANNWYEYTYWSSPVVGSTIADGLSDAQSDRIFLFNAQNFLDASMETNNDDTANPGQDDIDDDGNDWQAVSGATVMIPGVGYASTHDEVIFESSPFNQFTYTFNGLFNNGIINVPLYRNDSETNDKNWNFIGNPYPSAIDADVFFSTNPDVDGAIYLWSQNTPPSRDANGNQVINFSDSDYAIINSGVGQTAGGDNIIPNRFIPSGQGFFVSYSDLATPISTVGNISEGSVTFNNSMRVKGATDNGQFFKSAKTKKQAAQSVDNKLWLNLTSDNGVFNQTLIGYVDGATKHDDGTHFDTPKIASTRCASVLYSTIRNSDKKLAIQGKNPSDLSVNEKIQLGFSTAINVPTLYKISIAKLQGQFLEENTVYLKDKALRTMHNLSASDYTFTSEVGEFKNRFEIVFKAVGYPEASNSGTVHIAELGNNKMVFTSAKDVTIKTISVYDFLGNIKYNLKAHNHTETFTLSKLKANTIYVVKVELSDGTIVTKKAVKR